MFTVRPYMAIGKQIRHYRKKLGWGQKELSEASEVDIGTISALERRDSKSSEYFLPIAKAFGLTLEQLADETTDWPLDINRLGANNPSRHEANEPQPSYGWPFKDVSVEQYNSLSHPQRRMIEDMILTILNAQAPPEKQTQPGHNLSSS